MSHQLEGVFCRAVEVPLAEIKALLDSDAGRRNATAPEVVTAAAVYEDLSGYVLYVPFIGTDCDRHTKEAWATANALRAFLSSVAADVPPPLRPDADQTAPNYGAGGLGALIGLGLGAYIISKISPLFRRKEKK